MFYIQKELKELLRNCKDSVLNSIIHRKTGSITLLILFLSLSFLVVNNFTYFWIEIKIVNKHNNYRKKMLFYKILQFKEIILIKLLFKLILFTKNII